MFDQSSRKPKIKPTVKDDAAVDQQQSDLAKQQAEVDSSVHLNGTSAQQVDPAAAPTSIRKPSTFDLDKFKCRSAATVAGVENKRHYRITALPRRRILSAFTPMKTPTGPRRSASSTCRSRGRSATNCISSRKGWLCAICRVRVSSAFVWPSRASRRINCSCATYPSGIWTIFGTPPTCGHASRLRPTGRRRPAAKKRELKVTMLALQKTWMRSLNPNGRLNPSPI